jgi:hypothetical protein
MRRRQREALANLNLLELTPVRVAEWEEVDGRVILIRPLPKTRGLRRLIDRLLFEMSTRRVRLDEVGSAAWQLLDGQRTVEDVAAALRAQFGDAVDPAEERVGLLLRYFYQQLFVEFPGVDPSGP